MRKFVASIVLAVFIASLYTPLAAALTMPSHACCFAHGEHHCASAANPSGETSASAPCPHHPYRAISCSVLAAGQRTAHSFHLVSAPHIQLQASHVVPLLVTDADGRAPPAFLS